MPTQSRPSLIHSDRADSRAKEFAVSGNGRTCRRPIDKVLSRRSRSKRDVASLRKRPQIAARSGHSEKVGWFFRRQRRRNRFGCRSRGNHQLLPERRGRSFAADPITGERVETIRPVEISEPAALEAEPKSAARTGAQAIDALAVPSAAIGNGEVGEFDGVKTHEAVLRAYPEISIVGLGDGADAVEGEAVLAVPGLDIVLNIAREGSRAKRCGTSRKIPNPSRNDGRQDMFLVKSVTTTGISAKMGGNLGKSLQSFIEVDRTFPTATVQPVLALFGRWWNLLIPRSFNSCNRTHFLTVCGCK